MYVIEDIETSLWSPEASIYGYKLHNQTNVIELWKKVADSVNREFNFGHSELTDAKPHVYGDVASIEFGHNVIIFKKARKQDVDLLSRRYVRAKARQKGMKPR